MPVLPNMEITRNISIRIFIKPSPNNRPTKYPKVEIFTFKISRVQDIPTDIEEFYRNRRENDGDDKPVTDNGFVFGRFCYGNRNSDEVFFFFRTLIFVLTPEIFWITVISIGDVFKGRVERPFFSGTPRNEKKRFTRVQ